MDSLEKKLYSSDSANPKYTRRDFLKETVYLGSLVLGVEGVSGCLGRNTGVTPAPTVAPHVQFFRDNPELGYGFTSADEEWARNYLDTYGKEWFSSHPEFHETLNAKIRQERLILSEKLGQSFSAVEDIVGADWDYHLKLDEEGKSLFHLDADRMHDDFPNREDREIIYRGMWMPWELGVYDAQNGNSFNPDWTQNFDGLKKNLGLVFDGTLRNRVMDAYNSPDSKEIFQPVLGLNKYQTARRGADQRSSGITWSDDWKKTAEMSEKYDKLFALDERLDKLRFLYGYIGNVENMKNDRVVISEQESYYVMTIYAKALGGALFVQRAPYPSFRADHADTMFPVPAKIVNELKSKPDIYGTPIIGKGQAIGVFAEQNAFIEDYKNSSITPYVIQDLPTGEKIKIL